MNRKRSDCFAYHGGRCDALYRLQCDGCVFYKSRLEYDLEEQCAKKRIGRLPYELRAYMEGRYGKTAEGQED